MNFFLQGDTITVCSTQSVYEAISTHLLNGRLYPKFLELPQKNPVVEFIIIEPQKGRQIEGYHILAIPVNHTNLTVGYQVTSTDGKTVFYTADTGPGLANCWQYVSPQLLITEVTVPNRYEAFARESRHLTPSLLKQELIDFRELKGCLPQVVVVHMNPNLEKEIAAEITTVAEALNIPISLAYEGMQLHW